MQSKENLSLEQKIGQLVAVGFHGTALDQESVRKVIAQAEAGLLGGVIIYRYNIEGSQQLTTLLQGIHSARTPLPLFILVDQEGGKVQRINGGNGFSDTKSAQQVAGQMPLEEARSHYEALGRMLRTTGFNFDFAPCVDLDGDPQCPVIGKLERSYSADPHIVTGYAAAMVEGLRTTGIVSCLKHYPGHGRACGDSHMGLVDVTGTWSEEELLPYKELVKRGEADAVMTAHIIHNGVDPDTPATLSAKWIQRLRQDVGFEGVVVTDDLHMGAIINHKTLKEVLVQGLNAGLDLLIFSNNPLAAKAQGVRHDPQTKVATTENGEWSVPDPDLPQKIVAIVTQAIAEGSLARDVVERAYGRVAKLKEKLR